MTGSGKSLLEGLEITLYSQSVSPQGGGCFSFIILIIDRLVRNTLKSRYLVFSPR